MCHQDPSVFFLDSSTLSLPLLYLGRGTTWSQLPVFALELMFSLGPVPSPQAGSCPLPCPVRGVGDKG